MKSFKSGREYRDVLESARGLGVKARADHGLGVKQLGTFVVRIPAYFTLHNNI